MGMGICTQCGSEFEATFQRKLFCSDKCRARYNREHYLTCFYCGQVGSSREHIYPQSMQQGTVNGHSQDVVYCCPECNSTLGNKYPNHVLQRMRYLEQRIKVKYRLNKPTPSWSRDELEELQGNLKKAVESQVVRYALGVNKMLHLQARIYSVSQTLERCHVCLALYDNCTCKTTPDDTEADMPSIPSLDI